MITESEATREFTVTMPNDGEQSIMIKSYLSYKDSEKEFSQIWYAQIQKFGLKMKENNELRSFSKKKRIF